MSRFVKLFSVSLLAFGLSGCGDSGAEDAIKDIISLMNQMADAIDSKNEAKILEVANKLKEAGEKAQKLKPSKEEDARLEAKYKGELKAAVDKVRAAADKNPLMRGKIGAIPGL